MFNRLETKRIKSLEACPLPSKVLSFSKILIILCLLFFIALFFIPWQQTSKGHGRVQAYSADEREQAIDAPIDGRLGKWFVQEGSSIKEGDPIVEIYDNDPDFLKRLQTEREAILRKIQANRLGVETSFINVGRQKKLFEEGLSSRKNYEQANLEYTKYLAEEAKSSAELTSIDTKLARQSRQKILAPRDGIITKRMAGSVAPLVKSGERLATLVPETTSRIVELYVDGNDIPLIREGDKVRLQFEGWPSFQFSGWPNLSVGTFSAQVFFIDPIDNGEGKFRILITPEDEKLWPSYSILRQGVRVNGWIILNRVSLAYEIWRQLNGFPPLPSKKNNIAEKK